MDSQEFAKVLNNTVVSSSEIKDSEKYKPVLDYLSANKPGRLYRYRACNERNIDAFYKDQVWVSTPDCMNDGFDSRLYYDKEIIESYFDRWIGKMSAKIFDVSKGIRDIPEDFSSLGGIQNAVALLGSMSDNQLNSYILEYINYVKKELSSLFSILPSIPQQAVKFSCFSEDIFSAVMWGVYGSDESGFALEYDFPQVTFRGDISNSLGRTCTLYPVIYSNERFEVPEKYIRFLDNMK